MHAEQKPAIKPAHALNLAEALAPIFGATASHQHDWHEKSDAYAKLTRPDGFDVTITRDGARYIIRAWLPELRRDAYLPSADRNQQHRADISVSASKPPVTIAAEMRRRLLPDYERLIGVFAQANADAIARRQRTEAMGDELGAILGARGPHRAHNHPDDEVKVRIPTRHVGYGDWTPWIASDGERVNIELRSAPYALALAIARVIADWKP